MTLQVRDGWTAVCRGDEIVPNTGVCVLIKGKQVAVFKLEDESLYAIDNLDPFSGASVLSRGIVGDLKGEVVVASPVYKQHFNLKSGQCVEEQDVKLAVYPVQVEQDMIWVKL